MKKKTYLFIRFFFTLILFICDVTLSSIPLIHSFDSLRTETSKENQELFVTIFIHGIMSIRTHLTLGNIYRFMHDKITHTRYAKEVELMRNNRFFQAGQAMQHLGLHPIDITDLAKNNASSAIGALFDLVDHTIHPHRKNLYYTFGWSGLLSATQRYHDAHELYLAIETLVHTLKEQGITPRIRLIGYSHGGNVALNLAAIKDDYYPASSLFVDELVLIGVPLVTETDFLVANPFFKKIYHLVSGHDRIQRIDFFSFDRIFSRKFFKSRPWFTLPNNLFQIQIKLMKPIRSHKKEKVAQRTAIRKDLSNPAIISGASHLLRNVSPGHIELWFFGWAPQHYRSHFVFSPLPTVIFVPYILHLVQSIEKKIDPREKIIVDIRPDDNFTLVKQYKDTLTYAVYPFFEKKDIDLFKSIALRVKPDNFTEEAFNEQIKLACKEAETYYRHNIEPFLPHQFIPPSEVRKRKKRLAYTYARKRE